MRGSSNPELLTSNRPDMLGPVIPRRRGCTVHRRMVFGMPGPDSQDASSIPSSPRVTAQSAPRGGKVDPG